MNAASEVDGPEKEETQMKTGATHGRVLTVFVLLCALKT